LCGHGRLRPHKSEARKLPKVALFVYFVCYRHVRTVSATDAKQSLAALLDAPQREPVLIRRQNRDVAVIMSAAEYERIRDLNAAEFQRFCDRVAAQAKARGFDEAALDDLLRD
jgi:antitoxin Phd